MDQKKFLEYQNNDIETTYDGSFIDFYDDEAIEHLCYEDENEATLGGLIKEQTVEELRLSRHEREELAKYIKKQDKNYLNPDFDFVDDIPEEPIIKKKQSLKEKKNKNKTYKNNGPTIIKPFLSFVYFCLKVIFLLFLFFVIFSVSRYNYLQNLEHENISEVEKVQISEVEEVQTSIIETPTPIVEVSSELIEFKQSMIDNAILLNSIIEGEKDCINKLDNNIITLSEAAVYFDKTQNKKQDILDEFYNENIRKDFYTVQNTLKEIYIYSINLSKQIKIRYNNSASKSLAVNDFNDFIKKHTERISDYEILLSNFN